MYGTLEAAYIPGASWPCPARLAHISLELLTSMVVRCMSRTSIRTTWIKILGIPVVIDQYAPAIGSATSPVLPGSLSIEVCSAHLRTCVPTRKNV
jgi:hypothetical protein